MKTITLKDVEYRKIMEIKLKDPQNYCHHNWYEFLWRCAKARKKEYENETDTN